MIAMPNTGCRIVIIDVGLRLYAYNRVKYNHCNVINVHVTDSQQAANETDKCVPDIDIDLVISHIYFRRRYLDIWCCRGINNIFNTCNTTRLQTDQLHGRFKQTIFNVLERIYDQRLTHFHNFLFRILPTYYTYRRNRKSD